MTSTDGQRAPGSSVFADSCATADGWEAIGEGRVVAMSDCPGRSRPCLRKDSGGDPSGAFKSMDVQLSRGFVFDAWLYHCSDRTAGPADRLAVEDDDFNGYGFCLTSGGRSLWIERRDQKKPVVLSKEAVNLAPNTWYRFRLALERDSTITLHVFDHTNAEVAFVAPIEDRTHMLFERIAIHGGGPFYVRDLSITHVDAVSSR